ncbi:hypothetical protein KIN20_014714 [Parelaphostrongylus tenuis]|uniref:Uncharacterized protein n=1 Tax=Parelaphostrongylus tenuis TaxID=148309 RepID=A0AAD5MF98_PARTN|nr:hypothetical protein KIN20_014714 [Parelaphostrongylus tenuis]
MDLQVIMTVADYNWKEATHSRHKRDMTVVKMKNILESMVEIVRHKDEYQPKIPHGRTNQDEPKSSTLSQSIGATTQLTLKLKCVEPDGAFCIVVHGFASCSPVIVASCLEEILHRPSSDEKSAQLP